MATAVVSTSIGCEGIELTEGEHLLIADQPVEFAKKTVQLLQDEELRSKLGSNGRKLMVEKYDWRILAMKLDGIYRETCGLSQA